MAVRDLSFEWAAIRTIRYGGACGKISSGLRTPILGSNTKVMTYLLRKYNR